MDSPYIYQFNNRKKKDIINDNKIIEQREFSFPEYNIIIGLMNDNTLFIKCEYKQVFYQKILTFEELTNLSENLKKFNDIKDIYNIFVDIIKDNKIFVVQFNLNQIKFNLLLNSKKNQIQPIEIPLLRIESDNNKEIFDKKNNDNIYNDNDFIMMQNNTFDDNVDSVILGFVNNINSHMQANKIKNEKNNNITNSNKSKKRSNKKYKTLNKDNNNNLIDKFDFDDVSEINGDNKEKDKNLDINKLYNIVNDLKKELYSLKNNQKEQINDKEIKEIIKTNKKLISEISEIQSKLLILNEENIKNKEEIKNLKNIINNYNLEEDINIKSKENQNIGEDIQEYIHNKSFDKNNSKYYKNRNKNLRKSKANKNRYRGKSTPHYDQNDIDNNRKMESYIFKQKYKIKGDETEIDLTNEKIGDNGLEILSTIEFEEAKNLSLDDNSLINIKPLRTMKLSQLLVLNLDNNQISDLSVLAQVKFYQLQKLWLNNNNIKDISVFENVKFNFLQGLWLNNNSIEDISVFEKMKLNSLQKIYINNNLIKNIDCLEKMKLKNLQLLSFTNNQIDYNIQKNKNIIVNIKEKLSYVFY